MNKYIDEILLFWYMMLTTYLAVVNKTNPTIVLAVIALDAAVFGFYKWYNSRENTSTHSDD